MPLVKKQIDTLVSHTYGPYPHNVLFNEKFPSVGQIPVLSNLQMLCNKHEPIGFDETEYIIKPPPDSRVANGPVFFSGILRIESLEWLSEQGHRYLETDFKNYDSKIHLEHNQSGLTLKRLYESRPGLSEGLRIKVKVVYEKNLLAAYLTSKNQHEQMLIYAKIETGHLTFSVRSLHKVTYDMSRNFLDRYRLRALIVELIELDHGKTPLENRNIDWLIEHYFEHILPRSLNNRIITDPSLDHEVLLEPRHPRHVSHAEIRGYFASQAEWLLANQLATSSNSGNVKLVDIRQWISFCRQVRREVADAKRNGVRWGVPHDAGIDLSKSLSHNLAKHGQTESFWSKKLENAERKPKPLKRRSLSPEAELPQASVPIVSQFQYDSDFSEASTNAASDSEDESFYPVSKIPYFCLKPPEIPNGRFVWSCPGCDHYVDLLNLSPEILDHLPDDTKRVLGGKSWKVKDEPIQRLLFQVVSNHYRDHHLLPNGVQAVVQASGNEWCIEDCAQSSGRSSKRDWKKHTYTKVKQESIEDSMDLRWNNHKPRPLRRRDLPHNLVSQSPPWSSPI